MILGYGRYPDCPRSKLPLAAKGNLDPKGPEEGLRPPQPASQPFVFGSDLSEVEKYSIPEGSITHSPFGPTPSFLDIDQRGGTRSTSGGTKNLPCWSRQTRETTPLPSSTPCTAKDSVRHPRDTLASGVIVGSLPPSGPIIECRSLERPHNLARRYVTDVAIWEK